MIRIFLLLLVILFYLILVIYNNEDQVTLKYAFGFSTQPLPVHLLILVSFIAGMFLTFVLILPGWIHMRLEVRRQRRTIEDMDQEMNRLASTASREFKSHKTNIHEEPGETSLP